MSSVRMPAPWKLPGMAVEFVVGTVIVFVHLVIASRLDRPRALALAARTRNEPPAE